MKIVLVTPYAWTAPGGVNAHVASLAGNLRRRGHEVRILAPADGPVDHGVIPVGGTVSIPFNGSVARLAFGPRVNSRVRVALRRAQPDVVHVHEPFAPSVSLLATMASRAPVVATFHTTSERARIYRVAGIPLRPLWNKIAVKIAVSPAARGTVEGVFGPGVRVIPNGIDSRALADVPPVDPGTKTVLFFGRMEPRKGPQVLVDALPAIVRAHRDATVVFAGDGPLREQLEAAVPDDCRRSVSFIGAFDDSSRAALLASAAVACLPALGGESFGYVLLEAMAAGRPVVASAIPGYAAVCRHGVDGLLVPPDDPGALAEAVSRLLADGELAREMGAAGRESVRRFDWSALVAELEDAYREAVDHPRGRPMPGADRG